MRRKPRRLFRSSQLSFATMRTERLERSADSVALFAFPYVRRRCAAWTRASSTSHTTGMYLLVLSASANREYRVSER